MTGGEDDSLSTAEAATRAGYRSAAAFSNAMSALTQAGESIALAPGRAGRGQRWNRDKLDAWIAAGKPRPTFTVAPEAPADLRDQLAEIHRLDALARQVSADLDGRRRVLIADLRRRGMTQAEVAALVQLSPQRVAQLEKPEA